MKFKRCKMVGLVLALAISGFSQAGVSAHDIDKLDHSLTPLGAEMKGNGKTGWEKIPAWTGGLTVADAPRNYRPPAHHPDPFAGEKPLLVINAENMEKYKEYLGEGVQAMLKEYPQQFYIQVYPSHRTLAIPARIAENTKRCASTARLNGWAMDGCVGGTPFPIPYGTNSEQAQEILWNHITRYRGIYVVRRASEVAVQPNGSFSLATNDQEIYFKYYDPKIKSLADLDNKLFYFMSLQLAPARLAGGAVLVWETLDQCREPRKAWGYNAGQRRVRQAPNLSYDTPIADADGLRTADDTDMFNGAPDRYQWRLIGKKEMVVPYNDYELSSPRVSYKELLQPDVMNPRYMRWEMHRVWIIEGTLMPGKRHIYSKRRFYVDEDSWSILEADQYDMRGALWRVSLAFPKEFWEVPMMWSTADAYFDLQAHRYHVMGLTNESATDFDATRPPPGDEYFTPSALRRRGDR